VGKRVLLLAAIVALIAAAFFGGYLFGERPAASATHATHCPRRSTTCVDDTLRLGDLVSVPAIKQACVVSHKHGVDSNGGPLHPNFSCGPWPTAPQEKFHHQVVFYRNKILVWKIGKHDPVWSGKP
jgi:hypothetical protein